MYHRIQKRVLSAKGREAISKAQKARWAKSKNQKLNIAIQKTEFEYEKEAMMALTGSSPDYVSGFLAGFRKGFDRAL